MPPDGYLAYSGSGFYSQRRTRVQSSFSASNEFEYQRLQKLMKTENYIASEFLCGANTREAV